MENARTRDKYYLTCERYYIFELLIFAAGMMGAYTYNLRGGVFCNAQTANVMLMGVALGKGEIGRAFYYIIPIFAYLLGTIVSEILPKSVKKARIARWDTLLIGFEILVLFVVGFIPLSWPHQIVQVTINFICSMQYNTFREAQGTAMATTFVTNHVRQLGVSLAKMIKHPKEAMAKELGRRHFLMLLTFFLGALILTLLRGLEEKAIWIALVPLGISFGFMLYADLIDEKDLLEEIPSGH